MRGRVGYIRVHTWFESQSSRGRSGCESRQQEYNLLGPCGRIVEGLKKVEA